MMCLDGDLASVNHLQRQKLPSFGVASLYDHGPCTATSPIRNVTHSHKAIRHVLSSKSVITAEVILCQAIRKLLSAASSRWLRRKKLLTVNDHQLELVFRQSLFQNKLVNCKTKNKNI